MISIYLLEECYKKITSLGYKIGNLDCTVILEKPKIKPFVEEIRKNLAKHLNIPINDIWIVRAMPTLHSKNY